MKYNDHISSTKIRKILRPGLKNPSRSPRACCCWRYYVHCVYQVYHFTRWNANTWIQMWSLDSTFNPHPEYFKVLCRNLNNFNVKIQQNLHPTLELELTSTASASLIPHFVGLDVHYIQTHCFKNMKVFEVIQKMRLHKLKPTRLGNPLQLFSCVEV